ncbi:MAG: aminotransferase class III-fold pyridoxal phosphate-dependent enzyme, partial [Methylophilaceae bacterium]|nr:aminotransferase class III-fold pyridoxal phosphate-dependent enzyme [Methylophilaceae bacterium]
MHLMPTYSPQDLAFTHGQGMWLVDSEGRRYLDALSGVAVNSLGHAHPQWVARLTAQLAQLSHVSNHYQIPQQQALATRLCTISGMDNVFFCNSGCEANEAAIKLARLYAHQRGIHQPQIIVMENAFHGRTLATLSATGNPKVQKGFEPLVEGFVRVPFANLNALEQVAKQHPNVVALLVEPIQGEGGVRMPEQLDTYLEGLKTICQRHAWLLMLDEVQTGVGRTGKWFAFQHSRILPDVMTLAKGLGGGIPV